MDKELTDYLIEQCHEEVTRHQQGVYPNDFPGLPAVPAGRYTDEAFFKLEQEHIWSKCWLYAGFTSELPEPGSFKLWEHSGAPVVIVRGKDGQIRAFYNTCRHRGGALVREGSGKCNTLVCKFHSWTYELDGALRHIPGAHDFQDIDRSSLDLVPLRCELWGNMIFVCRDPATEPLLQWLGPLVNDLSDVGMDTRRAFRVQIAEMPCNWKIAIDAFVESYHLPQVHPKTVSMYVDHRGSHIELYNNGHSSMYTLQKKGEMAAQNSPLNGGGAGSPEHRIGREVIRGYTVFPNIQCSAAEHEFVFLMFWPTSIRTTRIEAVFTAPAGYDDPNSPGAQQLIAGYDIALAEDMANLSWLQKSIESGANKALPISYIERRIYHMAEAVDRCIGRHNIPAELQVQPVLEPYHTDPYSEERIRARQRT